MQFSKLNMLIKLGRDFGHEQIRDAGFSDTEHAICTFLCFHDQVSQDMIANALMLDKTTVAKALSAMEAKGLIVREQDGQNRRKNSIRITETGKESVSASMHIYDTWFSEVCANLSEAELGQFDDSIGKMIESALHLREQQKQTKQTERA
ncbi:MAG: MarR family winged helix-turn-helix transcriptional regulator [Clostridiaceae bacterium]